MKGLKTISIVTWCLIAVVGAFLLVGANLIPTRPADSAQSSDNAMPAIGKPFELVSHNGQLIDNEALRGKPYLAFFGFTHCPDICPTTLFELTDIMKELGATADQLNVALISVDPERDTQELLKLYMTSFDPRFLALRGTREQTDVAVKAFAAYAKKVPTDGGDYTMDHTAGVYLMDSRGNFKGTLDIHEPRAVRVQKIRNLVAASSLPRK